MAKRSDNVENTPEEITQEQLRRENEYVIKNKRVRRQTRRRALVIILLIFLLTFAILAGSVYVVMRFVEESNFRVSVTHTGNAWLSLSKDYNFTNPTSQLDVSAPRNLDNCTVMNYIDEQLIDISQAEGSYEAEGTEYYFVATTFYLKNSSDGPVKYSEAITLERMKKGMEQAIRVLVIKDFTPGDDKDGIVTVYAAPKIDGEGNYVLDDGNVVREAVVPYNYNGNHSIYDPRNPTAEVRVYEGKNYYQGANYYEGFLFNEDDFAEDGTWLARPFEGDGFVMKSEYYPLEKDQIIKYTMVIWLEGNDEQCVDDILGGQVKISAEFTTISA